MKYYEILSKQIEVSGKSLSAIVRECAANGVTFTVSYLSKLKNGRLAPPRDRVNNVLAKVLKCDRDLLLVASYREKIPLDILQKLGCGNS